MSELGARERKFMRPSIDTSAGLPAFATMIRNATLEEVAAFVETHYCIIDSSEPGGYKTCERTKHPNEPLARAIRGLKEVQP
jgi:hypothetical protein